jgi:hypothetical protein
MNERMNEGEGSQTESSPTADKTAIEQSQAPIHVDGDVNSNVDVDSCDGIDEEISARYENRPKIVAGVTWDEDGARRSIEIEPLFGESKEECKERITELLNTLQGDVRKGQPLPQCFPHPPPS